MEQSLFFKNATFFTKNDSNNANDICSSSYSNLQYRQYLSNNSEKIKEQNRLVAYNCSKYN
jgi:hypothetical protein